MLATLKICLKVQINYFSVQVVFRLKSLDVTYSLMLFHSFIRVKSKCSVSRSLGSDGFTYFIPSSADMSFWSNVASVVYLVTEFTERHGNFMIEYINPFINVGYEVKM